MASDAFLNSIEINFKKATQYIQKIYGSETFSKDLSKLVTGSKSFLFFDLLFTLIPDFDFFL